MIPTEERLRVSEVLNREKSAVSTGQELFAASMVSDYRLVLLVAVWPRVPLTKLPLQEAFVENDEFDDWDALWDMIDVDLETLAALMGVTFTTACEVFDRSVMLRLVFPDGTVPQEALKTAAGLTKAAIEVASKRGFKQR